ncbi:MAG TPA: hypothetical protein VHE35_18125 [Kofleriaceae bacterium]|nr:hypothetical protein [Kofleriaceae bacterium]
MPAPPRPSCPSCGIAVTPGYTRCPKCHRPLPSSTRFSRLGDSAGGGGTTSEPAEEPVTRWPWYLAGAVVLAGAVAVIILGAGHRKVAPPLPDDPVSPEQATQPPAAGSDEEPTTPPPPRPPDPAPIADRLQRLLGNARLFATVEAQDDTVEIRSNFCADPGMPGVIAQVAPDLRESGIVDVTCRALSGVEAWTRPLP